MLKKYLFRINEVNFTIMRKFLFIFLFVSTAVVVRAQLRVPQIIGSGMVLQQNSDVSIWGWADPGAEITLAASWSDEDVLTRTGADGRWLASVSTPPASDTPCRIMIGDGQTRLVFDDVLIGEVWFCSGQSNMEMPLEGYWNQPVEGSNGDIARAEALSQVRMATVSHVMASVPQEEVGGEWEVCTSETVPRFSATAFYFARMLREVLGVPVGIIHCSWGGSRIEGWMPRETVAEYADIDLRDTTAASCADWLRPTVMYNAMVRPLCNYTIRGFLWYQGCSNVGAHATYADRQAAMVAHWRELWGREELPFYFVEIAPYRYGEGDAGAYLREAQHRAAKLIPHCGIVSTADLVRPWEQDHIHPARKREVGERLACMALNRTYGRKGIACESPRFREMILSDDGSAVLAFDHAETGFSSQGPLNGPFDGFEAAGADRIFRPAKAMLLSDEHRIRVSLPDGTPVVAVRCCFHDWAPAKVWNGRGLPLLPFRTDDW